MIIAAQSKEVLTEYFLFLLTNLANADFSEIISKKSIDLLDKVYYLKTQTLEQICQKHFLFSFEDNFAIYSACLYLKEHSEIIRKIENYDKNEYSYYLETLLNVNLNHLFDPEIPIEKKLLIRTWFLKDSNVLKNFEFDVMILSLNEKPPKQVNRESLQKLREFANSKAMKEAIEIFIEDTLNMENPPFSSIEEGRQMIEEVFDWAVTQGKTYYADLLGKVRDFSSECYIYIHSKYKCNSFHDKAFRILTFYS